MAIALLAKLQNSVSNDKDKLRILSLSSDWLQKSLSILNQKEHTYKVFRLMDQNKSVLLLQATKSEATNRLGNLPDSLVWQDKKMHKKQSKLQAKLLEFRPEQEKDSLRNKLNHVNQDIDDFVGMLEKEYPQYHQLKYQQVVANVKEIQALLEENTALVEYVLSDSVVHIFVVDKTEVKWIQQAIKRDVLLSKVEELHQVLSDYSLLTKNPSESYQKYTHLAFWLYKKLLDPVLKKTKNLENIIFVTDGELGHLPFEAFLVEAAPHVLFDYNKLHYLVNDYNISYNYSATLWKENAESPKPTNNGQNLPMAANYETKLDSNLFELRLPTDQWLRKKLKPLPAAQ